VPRLLEATSKPGGKLESGLSSRRLEGSHAVLVIWPLRFRWQERSHLTCAVSGAEVPRSPGR
jgi:hypothetical protein